ncbi:hypothetical protein [Propionivibrio sp.]|uniref:hypothetical protein n=1 Tax=Propionivibrio sp. TaxID=2212460 RepID=UPI003BF5DAB6
MSALKKKYGSPPAFWLRVDWPGSGNMIFLLISKNKHGCKASKQAFYNRCL